jgi:2-polyprenyl-6-methoxyphenol hydroxylase-like FAD-dependent oxidoreductase
VLILGFALGLGGQAFADPKARGAAPHHGTGTAEPRYDAVVVGAGPGGLVAAMSAVDRMAARGGATRGRPRVLLVEKRGAFPKDASPQDREALEGSAFSRDQVISLRAAVVRKLEELDFHVPDRFRAKTRQVAWETGVPPRTVGTKPAATHPLRSVLESESTHTIAINELQKLLLDHAKARGVELEFGCALTDLEPGRDHVRLSLENKDGNVRRVRARFVVGADGTQSVVREKARIGQTPTETHGLMMGAWLRRSNAKHELVYQEHAARGKSAVLLGTNDSLYGLFALPPRLARMLEAAKAEKRDLTSAERARIDQHAETVASRMLGRRTDIERISPFPIKLARAERAASLAHRALLVGDAVQSVNPHTGSGANLAMAHGLRAGETIGRAVGEERRESSAARRLERLFRRYSDVAIAGARDVLDRSRALAHTFEAPRSRRAFPTGPVARRTAGSEPRSTTRPLHVRKRAKARAESSAHRVRAPRAR